MNHCERLLILSVCLACAACSKTEDTPPVKNGVATPPVSRQQTPLDEPATSRAVDAAELLAQQTALREEFDGWQRDTADESKPVEQRQVALTSLTDHAKRASGVEQKPWGTVRNDVIDEESAKVLRQLVIDSDQAAIRRQAIETLGQMKDIDGIDAFLAALADESLEVRQAAIEGVRNIMSTDYGYRAEDPPGKRAKAIRTARRFWEACLANARFVQGMRNPALLQKWKKSAKWDDDAEPRFKEPATLAR
ncbi:MAG: HEAT repeat domain-containing protein [Pirellulales bacterium]|nr:HEAT repeat domain-containing protein [Pirellulales bacterium]